MQRQLLLLAFCALFAFSQALEVTDAVKLVAGFLEAVIQNDHLDELQQCVTATETLIPDVENVVEDIKPMSLEGFLLAVLDIGKVAETSLP